MTFKKKLTNLFNAINLMDFRGKREAFYEQLAKSIENKEQFKTFLEEELKIARHKRTRNSSREAALKLMVRKLSLGDDFLISQILGTVMPQNDRMMLAAVDEAKDKPGTLRALAAAIKSQKEAKSVIWKAIFPPMVLIPGVAGFSYVLATQSIPIIVKVAPPEVWTPFNMSVRIVSEIVASHGGLIVASVIGAIAAFTYALPRWKGNLRSKLEQVPQGWGFLLFPVAPFLLPLSIYRDFQVSLLVTSLAVLLKSGATLSSALDTLKRNADPWMRWHLKKIMNHLNVAPTDYIPAFSKGLMSPKLLARLATTIRNNPQFDKILIQLGTEGGEDIRNEIGNTAKGLNAVLLSVAAAVVVFLYVGQLSISQSMTEELDPVKRMQRMR